jgi:hypothetical protein
MQWYHKRSKKLKVKRLKAEQHKDSSLQRRGRQLPDKPGSFTMTVAVFETFLSIKYFL